MSKEKLRKELQKIVESIKEIEPVAEFDSDQWKKGNASIKRIDKSLSSLNVNIQTNNYTAGIDGKNKGDIFDMLKREFERKSKNDLNERFNVPCERIEEVIRYYAGVEKENMEPEFRTWYSEHAQLDTSVNTLCRCLRETIPNWELVNHPNLFTIQDVKIIDELHTRCLNGGDLHELSQSVGRGTPSMALGQYINFLESTESTKSPNKEGENIDDELAKEIKLLRYKKQIILQGSPGTGKTRLALRIAEKLAPNSYKLIQFHPAYSYEDFVRGIVATTTNGVVSYAVQNKVLAEMAKNALDNPNNNFVLIIDEINRANLSSVLGELIYALEYRGKEVESMYEYQKSRKIILPENLYIIGTMNTADRSVGHIDYAIRRRFAFVNVDTDESVILNNTKHAKPLFNKVEDLFDTYLNKEEFELNDVMIGHSYFLEDNLELALEYEIKPILQEYRKDGVLMCKKSVIDKLDVD